MPASATPRGRWPEPCASAWGSCLRPGTAAHLPWQAGNVQSTWLSVWPQEALAKGSSPRQPLPPARPPRHPCPCCRLAGWAPWRAISHGWARPLPRHVPTSGLRRRSPSVPLAGPSSGSPCPSHVTSSMPVLTGSGSGRPTCPPESHGDREARPRAGLSLPACPGVSVGSNMRPPDLPAARLPMLVPGLPTRSLLAWWAARPGPDEDAQAIFS